MPQLVGVPDDDRPEAGARGDLGQQTLGPAQPGTSPGHPLSLGAGQAGQGGASGAWRTPGSSQADTGPLHSRLGYHWSRTEIRIFSYAIKTQLKALKAPVSGHFLAFAVSLCHKSVPSMREKNLQGVPEKRLP